MIGIILSILTGILAAMVVIKKENQKLKNKERLHEIEVEDAKLETKQESIKLEKNNLATKLEELDKNQAPSLQDSEIEKYWNKK
jgi:hypothetical protein